MQAPAYTEIGRVLAPGLSVELRMSPCNPTEISSWTSPVDILTFRFGPKAQVWSRLASGEGAFTLDGPLTFRPRLASWETKSNGAAQLSLLARFEKPLKYSSRDEMPVFSINDTAMFSLMRMLHDEVREPGFSSPALVESIGKLLRIKLRRQMQNKQTKSPNYYRLSTEKLKLVDEYIVSLKGKSPTVQELALICQISPRSLLRQMRVRTGMSVAGYITHFQLERSKSLLIGSEMMVKQIAFEVGFTDANHFSTAFKRLTGFSPVEFRALSWS